MQTATDLDAAVMALVPGLEYVTTFVPLSKSRNKGESCPTINWEIEMRHGGARIVTDYGQGVGIVPDWARAHLQSTGYDNFRGVHTIDSRNAESIMVERGTVNGRNLPAPSVADVLYCLLGDAEALDYATFEEWAENYGYDTDSRKAEAIYRKCLEIGLRLRAMFGDAKMAELREALQDM